jgi:hypothetical protein
MTRVYEDAVEPAVPAKIVKKFVRRTCDLCGVASKRGEDWEPISSSHNVNETEVSVTVKHRMGWSYPEGGSGTEVEVDLCPKCFKDRLIPWRPSQGAPIEVREWEF